MNSAETEKVALEHFCVSKLLDPILTGPPSPDSEFGAGSGRSGNNPRFALLELLALACVFGCHRPGRY
jgi:hypothetical protein